MKKILNYSLLFCCLVLISCSNKKEYKREDNKIYFGNYPQEYVSDELMISKLNNKVGNFDTEKWTDYKVSGVITDYMYYLDIDYDEDGVFDYRGVYIKKYIDNYVDNGWVKIYRQQGNGFELSKIYYFKYEPIEWNILKEENGKAFINSKLVLDSQDFYYPHPTNDDYKNADFEKFNYELSYIRKWLNDIFYKIAFNELERKIIIETKIDNSDEDNPNVIFNDTNDYIFLLSYKEAEEFYPRDEGNYNKSETSCSAGIYAFSQGLRGFLSWSASGKIGDNWADSWNLRTIATQWEQKIDPYYVNDLGGVSCSDRNVELVGVRPSCWIEL